MKKYSSIKIILSSLFLTFAIGFFRSTSFYLSTPIGFLAYFLFIIFLCGKFKNTPSIVILRDITIGFFVIQLIPRVIDFTDTLHSLPDFIVHTLGLISGLFYLFFGLVYLRKTLLLFYSERIT